MPADDALTIIAQAAGDPLLGEDALSNTTVTAGATTLLFSFNSLLTYTNDTRWRTAHLLWPDNTPADQQRRIYSSNGALGQVQVLQPLSGAPIAGARALLFRDFSWSDWLDMLNETARSLYYDKEVELRGITNLYRYTLPTPLSEAGWVRAVYVGDYPYTAQNPHPPSVQWYRLNPVNIEGDIHLVLRETLDAAQNLVFHASIPYAHPHMSVYTMTRSVLTPFGETTAINIPRNYLVAGVVWRALVRKTTKLTGQARTVWLARLDLAARRYAGHCAAQGVDRVGMRQLGYGEVWW